MLDQMWFWDTIDGDQRTRAGLGAQWQRAQIFGGVVHVAD